MSGKPPSRRLVDVLRQNSKETLDRHAAQLASAASSLPSTAIHNRFLRNKFLVSPNALHLLFDEAQFTQQHLFAVYKPPFCPMKRSEASENYHKVSVESFVSSALTSATVQPLMMKMLRQEDVKIRILNTLDIFSSGPVVVSVSDQHEHATSLPALTMEYDVMVAGHLPVHDAGNATAIAVHHLFGDDIPTTKGSPSRQTRCEYEVKRNGYYSIHPVSLLKVRLVAPPTASPPRLEEFVREQLHTSIIGDPLVVGELLQMQDRSQKMTRRTAQAGSGSSVAATSTVGDAAHSRVSPSPSAESQSSAQEAAMKLAANPHIVPMRGDCDFPRVFTHLSDIRIASLPPSKPLIHQWNLAGGNVTGTSAPNSSDPADQAVAHFHCWKCFDSLLQQQRSSSLKVRRLGMLDGTWVPQTEFI